MPATPHFSQHFDTKCGREMCHSRPSVPAASHQEVPMTFTIGFSQARICPGRQCLQCVVLWGSSQALTWRVSSHSCFDLLLKSDARGESPQGCRKTRASEAHLWILINTSSCRRRNLNFANQVPMVFDVRCRYWVRGSSGRRLRANIFLSLLFSHARIRDKSSALACQPPALWRNVSATVS